MGSAFFSAPTTLPHIVALEEKLFEEKTYVAFAIWMTSIPEHATVFHI